MNTYKTTIRQYLDYKHALGFKMKDPERVLWSFEKFATAKGYATAGISEELFIEWSLPNNLESERNRYYRISTVRAYSNFLLSLGHDSFIPKLPKWKSSFSPHIFTAKELNLIFNECDKLCLKEQPRYSNANVMPCLIRLLYGTGLRISEALSLKHKNVNLEDSYIIINDSKNGQGRVVPISISLREICKEYLNFKRTKLIDTDDESLFFTALNGTPTKRMAAYNFFRIVLFRAGIPYEGKGKGPRLHDLRHTFCVNALVQLVNKGYDLYYSMPILMNYMGHRSIESTNYYIKLTEEMFPSIISSMDDTYKSIFQNYNND